MKSLYDIIQSRIITEKADMLSETLGKYVLKVAVDANKINIKKAVEKIFSVKVKSVNVVNRSGKMKTFKGRAGRTAAYKKAIITLEPGQNLEFNN